MDSIVLVFYAKIMRASSMAYMHQKKKFFFSKFSDRSIIPQVDVKNLFNQGSNPIRFSFPGVLHELDRRKLSKLRFPHTLAINQTTASLLNTSPEYQALRE